MASVKRPVAYLRKSTVTSDRHVSWEIQEQEIRDLAGRHGDTDLLVLSDWSKSGRGAKVHLRGEYARLRALISADQVSAVYSYSLSRLSRSLGDYIALAELCRDHKVPIRLAKEGALDYSTTAGKLVAQVLAAAAEAEADWGKERAADAVRARRERGDVLGLAPYGKMIVSGRHVSDPAEPLEPLVAAFERAGSAYGAARILNEDGVRTRRGGLWSSKVVGDILIREGAMAAGRKRPGVKAEAGWLFYRLLICPCGNVMTGMDNRAARYTCYRARHTPGHPRPFGIAESKLVPAIRAEADRLRVTEDLDVPDTDDEQRARIARRRERVMDLYVSELIDKVDRDRRLEALDEELEQLGAERRMVELPDGIDWSLPPRELNVGLRLIFDRIELGPDLMPARFHWKVPRWRSHD